MSLIVDILSICSVVGIWPRYIEPKILKKTELTWKLGPDASHLDGFTIAQISDLHFNPSTPQKFLDKLVRRTLRQKPDVILFTGDFICYSRCEERERLKNFLSRLQAPHGCYCIFGNHDYSSYVSMSREGVYDLLPRPNPTIAILRGLHALLRTEKISYAVSDRAKELLPHPQLLELLDETPFTLLENATVTLPLGINITGLGEYSVDRCRPKTAFSGFDKRYPGIVLTHNPDTFELLQDSPASWIFAGHTHGEQIHLPFCRPLSRKLARLQHKHYTRGYFEKNGKHLYVSRGVGAPKPFRFCSPPELVILRGKR